MDISIQPLYLLVVVVLWVVAYHVSYWLVAIAREPSLVFWSVGPFGVSVVALREPPVRRLVAQLGVAAVVLAGIAYGTLFLLNPPPIAGLDRTLAGELAAVAIPVAAISLSRVLGIAYERRHPLWGEARVLTGAQRSLATRSRIYFTTAGRAFLRERFGATPHEFLRMVRY